MNSDLTVTLKLTLDDASVLDFPIIGALQDGDGEAFIMDLHEMFCIEGIGFLELVGKPVVNVNI